MDNKTDIPAVQANAAPKKQGLWDRAYEALIDGGPAKVSIVERIDEPMTVWESAKNTAVSAAQGALIGGALTGVAGAIIGAVSGSGSDQGYVETLGNEGQVTLGASSLPGIVDISGITLANSGTLEAMAESAPAATNMALSALDTGLQLMPKAAVVGGIVGAIKGGWADRITRERELVAAHPIEKT